MTGITVVCIYCGSNAVTRSVAHIVPESLGGPNSPVGRPGTVCDKCNQYFGQKVESKALRSFPFLQYRAITGVPSKKGKEVFARSTLGNVSAGNSLNTIAITPITETILQKVMRGEITQMRILAQVSEPLAVCQTLLKIGLELLAKINYEVAISDRVSNAIEFARRPKRGSSWWFILNCRPDEMFSVPSVENHIEIIERESVLLVILRLHGVTAMTPLEHGIEPPELPEPEYMVVRAVC